MRLGTKREESHEHRYVHIIDPPTSRGLLLYCDREIVSWKWVKIQDVEGVNGQEAMLNYLANNGYVPREVPDQEFNGLYEKLSFHRFPMFRDMEDFEPSETPTIQEIVEQSCYEYARNILDQLASAKHS